MIPAALKKWLAFGSGVGIQIAGPRGAESLHVAAVRVRPGGAAAKILRGGFTIEDFPQQPAAVWGADYAAFLRKLGMRHVSATAILPRQDVIVRTLTLPGVSDKDLDSAVRFQMDGLHPYSDDDVYSSWARLPGTSTVLVGVVRREVVDRYALLFAEAGIKIRAFTCSASAVYSALRLFGAPASTEFLSWDDASSPIEFYGESPARQVFSASFDLELARAAALAASELRIDSYTDETPALPLSVLLGAQPPLAYAAALNSACPGLSLNLNLLPPDRRQSTSALQWIPSAAVGVVVLMLAGALAAFPGYESRRYQRSLEQQIAAAAPAAAHAGEIDKQIANVRARTQLLDDLRRRPKADMDVLAELTRILPPPTWLNLMELTPRQVIVGGESNQAAPLLTVVDSSPLFESSEFQMGPVPIPTGAMFRIRTNRKGVRP